MILDELTLHNFGVYKGEHKIVLSPVDGRPVILVGGLNGGGKTTFLEALQLVLYGRHARSVEKAKAGYSDYLKRSIHRGVLPSQGAGIELAFRYRIDGREEKFRVLRTWREFGATVRENVEVYRDDELDQSATERWHEFVEQFIPNQMSDLFFFDGEKIESLADPDHSAELLRVGVHALLGLDLVDDLSRSLLQVERRRKTKLATESDQDEMRPIELSIEAHARRRAELAERLAALQIQLDGVGRRRVELESKFKADGGELFERREEIKLALAQHRARVALTEDRLCEIAAGLAPLLLVKDLLAEVQAVSGREADARRQTQFTEELEERDQAILLRLTQGGVGAKSLSVVKEVLQRDRQERRCMISGELFLGVTPESLASAATPLLTDCMDRLRREIETHAEASEEVARWERAEAAIPDTAKLEELVARLASAREEEASLSARNRLLREEYDQVEIERQSQVRERDRLLELIAERRAADQITRRVISHASRCRETLQRFRQSMRERHVSRLEVLVTESFQRLLRKKSLVHHVSIHPETFALHIRGENDVNLAAETLSAGERQLLAVSVLWGLAKASGRQLPAVIDTPLGRLDSEHRSHLVRHYFPVASHQVILLSTDEEIEGRYYEEIRPAVGREYLITYDHSTHSSSIEPGYFSQARIAA